MAAINPLDRLYGLVHSDKNQPVFHSLSDKHSIKRIAMGYGNGFWQFPLARRRSMIRSQRSEGAAGEWYE